MVTDWHFTQRQPTEWSYRHPTTSVKQCIMSPVKPLQCRSVTTHLFSQHSLASLSDCSVSSPNPDLSQQQRCRVAAALDFSGNTPSQSYCYWVPRGLFDLFWLRLIWNILVKILFYCDENSSKCFITSLYVEKKNHYLRTMKPQWLPYTALKAKRKTHSGVHPRTTTHSIWQLTNYNCTCIHLENWSVPKNRSKNIFEKVHLKLVLTLWQSISYSQRWFQSSGEMTCYDFCARISMWTKQKLSLNESPV